MSQSQGSGTQPQNSVSSTTTPQGGSSPPDTRNADALRQDKQVAFYAALVTAWIETRMERDKQILVLSAAGLSGLIALAQSMSANTGNTGFVLWLLAGLFFLLAIGCGLVVLGMNAGYLAKLIVKENSIAELPSDKSFVQVGNLGEGALNILDRTFMSFFVLGVLFTSALAISATNYTLVKQPVVSQEETKHPEVKSNENKNK